VRVDRRWAYLYRAVDSAGKGIGPRVNRFIKRCIVASLGFRSAEGAWRTVEGYEAMHAIRKG
jgi:transposase-like protein